VFAVGGLISMDFHHAMLTGASTTQE